MESVCSPIIKKMYESAGGTGMPDMGDMGGMGAGMGAGMGGAAEGAGSGSGPTIEEVD